MDIRLTVGRALEIAEGAYDGPSDVLTVTPQPRENVASLDWWQADQGGRDRGWRGRRDWGALHTYLELSRHAVSPLPADEFPTEFHLLGGAWCRPDKEIIKQGLRRRYLAPVLDGERLEGFRITDEGLGLLRRIFPAVPVG